MRPWLPGENTRPTNVHTGNHYRGGNYLGLTVAQEVEGFADQRWGTYRQIGKQGGQVRKGSTSTPILLFVSSKRVILRDENGKPVKDANGKTRYTYKRLERPYTRVHHVFNVEQADGIDPYTQPEVEWDAHDRAEQVVTDNAVPVKHVPGDRAYYRTSTDRITMPTKAQFPERLDYYQTLLHEIGHATGHPTRLNRETLTKAGGFGSESYALEELRAEICAMMVGEEIGTGHNPERGAAYVASWVKKLKDDPYEIRRAAAEAQKMADYILGAPHQPKEKAA